MQLSVLFKARLIITQKATSWKRVLISIDAHLANQHFLHLAKSNYFYHLQKVCSDGLSPGGHEVSQRYSFFSFQKKHKKAGIRSETEKRGNPLITIVACCCFVACKIAPFLQCCG